MFSENPFVSYSQNFEDVFPLSFLVRVAVTSETERT